MMNRQRVAKELVAVARELTAERAMDASVTLSDVGEWYRKSNYYFSTLVENIAWYAEQQMKEEGVMSSEVRVLKDVEKILRAAVNKLRRPDMILSQLR